ncbi:hypothetical protein D0T12_24600 [Actinomadura spongiicola]|uniref:Uncharacterized protein n=1 Tax=Actinomadura spongiicola TaxID=2303421 RepID=A0A372GB48_9ACTN|nr:hypothetical protein [Actinomadura spongiicola]RFS82638.1 hypothetical protein D0T12_24600 [Actinomadura spongiicola]
MSEPAAWTHQQVHHQVHRRVHAAMTAAMRADVHAIEAALARTGDLDPYSREFVAGSRRLVLAGTAALTCVLSAHRPGDDPHGGQVCRGCGTRHCRTLHGVADVLAAYTVHPGTVDRAEAWRRADAHFGRGAVPVPVIIEEFADGFIARAADGPHDDPAPLLIVDRHTGALSRWPSLPVDVLVREYTNRRASR